MSPMTDWRERIMVDPQILVGKPVIRGTRIAVELVIDLLARGYTKEQILDQYDHITDADIQACLAYASEALRAGDVSRVRDAPSLGTLASRRHPE